MASKNSSKQDPKDNGNPAAHTKSPGVQKKKMFLSKATQLNSKLSENSEY